MSHWDDVRLLGELVGRSGFSLSLGGGVIEMRRGPSFAHLAARLVITLFLLPFLLAPLLLLLEPDIPFNVPAALFYLVWYGTLGGFATLAGAGLFRWRLVRVDGDRGRLELRGSGRFLWLRRRVSVPLGRVRELRLGLGPEGLRPTPFAWRVTYEARGKGRRKVTIAATVETIDRREEALDLTARVAGLMGWKAFELTRDDPLRVTVRFARSEAELEDPRPIPALPEAPDYEEDRSAEGLLPPEPELPPFDPGAYGGLEEVVAWEPGRRVELLVRPFTGRQTAWAALAAGLFFGTPIALFLWMLSLALPQASRPWLLFGLAQSALTAAAVLGFLVWRFRQSRRVEIDWPDGRLTLRKGEEQWSVGLEGVRGLEVRGTRSEGAGRGRAPLYRCEVVALLDDGLVVRPVGRRLGRSGRPAGRGAAGSGRPSVGTAGPAGEIPLLERQERGDPTRPYREAGAFAAEVAEALGVPWEWSGYRRG